MLTPYHILPDDTRVWVYQANRTLTQDEVWEISDILENFADRWQAHQQNVHGLASIYYRRFIVLMADESKCEISGCSIDSSVRLIKELEQAYQLNFFDRMKFCYKITSDMVGSFSVHQLPELIESGKLKEDTIVFNNLVATKKDFETKWEIPFKESAYTRFASV